MTSTTSSLNRISQFRRTYLWALKKNAGMAALLALLLFLANPLLLLIALPNAIRSLEDQMTAAQKAEELSRRYTDLVSNVAPPLAVGIVLLFSAILCILLFGYLQKKRSVDLFHALPVGRGELLLGRWCAGLTVLLVPVLLNFAIMGIIGASYGVSVTADATPPFVQMLWVMLLGAASFTFCMFMMICAGTTLDAVLSALGINIGYPLLILCADWLAGMLVPGFDGNVWQKSFATTALAPFAAAFAAVLQKHSVWFLLWWIVMTALLLAGSVFLYRRRRSESAEDNFAFPLPKLVVRFLLTAVGGLAFGLFLSGTSSSEKGFFVGVLFGSVATHIIVETIYSRGFQHLKKSFVGYAVFAVAFIAFYGILCTGLFGYDTRVPELSEVESLSIGPQNGGNGDGSQLIFNSSYKQIAALTPTIRERRNLQTAIEAQQEIISQYRSQFPYRIKTAQSSDGMTFSYRLKNGRVFTRTYRNYYSGEENMETVLQSVSQKIGSMKEFTETRDLIFYVNSEAIKSIDVCGEKTGNKSFALSAEAAKQLQEAIQQDFLNQKVNQEFFGVQTNTVVNVLLNYQETVKPQTEKMKSLLNGYEGPIVLEDGSYDFTDGSSTYQLLKKWGWV